MENENKECHCECDEHYHNDNCSCDCEDECCDCKAECGCDENKQESQKDDLEQLRKEQVALKDAVLRAHAEIENIRKRTVKEKEDSLKFANTKFAKELLDVIDNLDRALNNAGDVEKTAKTFFDGIKLTHKTLVSAFAKNGITKIETKKSDTFNHDMHQIMCEVEAADVDEGKVVDIYQNGYMINGRLLRPVLVSVAKKK